MPDQRRPADSSASPPDAKTQIREITPLELKSRLASGDAVVCVDVRESNEWNLFRIPGAQHVPLSELEHRASELPGDRDIILYCGRGNRSIKAAELLRDLGHGRVASLTGGIMAWVSAGGDVEE